MVDSQSGAEECTNPGVGVAAGEVARGVIGGTPPVRASLVRIRYKSMLYGCNIGVVAIDGGCRSSDDRDFVTNRTQLERATMKAELIWESARELLLPYEGMASQIYVLDVPLSESATVLDLFARFVENPVVIGFASLWSEPRALTPALKHAISSHRGETSMHQLKGSRLGREDITLLLSPGR
ncbi:MAG: hypothetical protein ACI81R_003380, partial [Bradymonadia bacterium]